MKLIDLSHTISEGMGVFPGDLPVHLNKNKEIRKDGYNNFQLQSGMHIGTHVDGPMHLTLDNRYISEIPLDKFTGEGVVFNVQGIQTITLDNISPSEIKAKEIILFYSGLDISFGEGNYFLNHPVFDEKLIGFLAKQKIKMIGIDWCSPDDEPYPLHQVLLKNDILIIENLKNLHLLLKSEFEIFAFPLKINADSSILRVVARVQE